MEEIMEKHYGAKEWGKLLKQFEVSGLTRSKFCKQYGFSKDTFYYWSKKLRPDLVAKNSKYYRAKVSSGSSFLPIKYESNNQKFKVTMRSGIIIEFESSPNELNIILNKLDHYNEVVQ
jgi:hypothetical protein